MNPAEFTGERVIPGQVDVDLWNEHFSRYALACRYAAGKRVLDLGCGTGYGTAELARHAASATGVDVAAEAVAYARQHYSGIDFRHASATVTGLPDASFDVITAFEVIEHLEDWRSLLAEARRLLASGGLFLVSTPNREYYAESRGASGPNPFHEHEFEYEEFRRELSAYFPSVTLLLQNRTEAFSFASAPGEAASRIDGAGEPSSSAFFLALCGDHGEAASFVYVPAAANLLRERERHIAKLRDEVMAKDGWLEQTRAERDKSLELYASLEKDLEQRNTWAKQLEAELAEAREHLTRVQSDLEVEQAEGRRIAEAYEAKVAQLETDVRERTAWAQDTEARLGSELEAKSSELSEAVRLLDIAEATVTERTRWATGLDEEVKTLRAQMDMIRASRWVKLGRAVGVGPRSA